MPYTHYEMVVWLYHVSLQIFGSTGHGSHSLSWEVCQGEGMFASVCVQALAHARARHVQTGEFAHMKDKQ